MFVRNSAWCKQSKHIHRSCDTNRQGNIDIETETLRQNHMMNIHTNVQSYMQRHLRKYIQIQIHCHTNNAETHKLQLDAHNAYFKKEAGVARLASFVDHSTGMRMQGNTGQICK